MKKIILGFVGPQSGGKDTVADYLCKKYGFVNISTGDMIRDCIRENNMGKPDRDKMQKVANEQRAKYGTDVFVRRALKNKSDRIAVTGIRAVGEAQGILNAGGDIISVDSPIEIRYERISSRGRVGDDVSFEKFKAQEDAEKNENDPTAQNIPGVMKMAKYHIDNIGTIMDLYKKADELAIKLGVK